MTPDEVRKAFMESIESVTTWMTDHDKDGLAVQYLLGMYDMANVIIEKCEKEKE